MPNYIEIPQKLDGKLQENGTFDGFVKSSVSEFTPWLKNNNVKFFSEYTDHSLEHVEGVLETADRLIRENCRGIITAGDVATLILAALLHDCAMHLSEDGFATLIRSDNMIDGFGDKPWSALWEDFIAESRRFSGRKLMALFGNTKPLRPPPSAPRALDSHEMTGRDLLLIGEFLRRHHHRLAHEIAVYGVPGPNGHELKLPVNKETKHIVELAGVVARSHGLPIRSCHDYLRDRYSSVRNHKGVHPVFLMALLRTADILQLQSSRAPRQVSKVRSLRSPVSQGEWEMHEAIEDIKWDQYPETVFIHAEPPNARTFLRIKDLLTQIQHELDSSWTVMSEAYYPEESLRALGLTIRRVRSNLDDVEAFAKKVEYIPCRAAFEVADTDLLKLLIGPLYGEKPEIGIRELLQNAIDAVRERRSYLEKHPELKDVEFTEQEADVVVSIDEEDDGWWVTVSDTGIGMTLDTVRNYFLKAGASLRRSEIWRKTFEDEKGKSQVLRSGRFGVGVLAAYLLGEEVTVSTRYITEPEDNGISFITELDADTIELQKIKRPVGTAVRVRIRNEVKGELLGKWDEEKGEWSNQYIWDWYCLTDPEVLLTTDHGRKKLRQKFQMPTLHSELPTGWNRITHPDYQDIHWTYCSDFPELTCNGIKIIENDFLKKIRNYLWSGNGLEIKVPIVSVFDFDANFPLNLLRDDTTQEKLPFNNELQNDVLKDFIAFALANAPSQPGNTEALFTWCSEYQYPDSNRMSRLCSRGYLFPWVFNKYGISLSKEPWHTSRINVKYGLVLQLYGNKFYDDTFMENIFPGSSHVVFTYSHDSSLIIFRIERLFECIMFALNSSEPYYESDSNEVKQVLDSGKRALISRHILRKRRIKNSLPKNLMDEIVEEWKNDNWVLWRLGDCPSPGFDFEKFAAENDGKNFDEWPCVLAEWYFKDPKPQVKESEMSPLAKVWRDVVGTPIIPFDLEERRSMKAYKELKPYIEAHEKMKKVGEETGQRNYLR